MKKLYLLILLVTAQLALSDEDTLQQCRQIEPIIERVACYDRFVDMQYPIAVQTGNESEPLPAAEATTVPDAQSLFGTDDARAKRIVQATLDIEQIDQIAATISDVHRSAARKLTVTLDNGQVWRQLDSKTLHLKSGDNIIVRKASLNSYLMEKESGSRSIRVKRAN